MWLISSEAYRDMNSSPLTPKWSILLPSQTKEASVRQVPWELAQQMIPQLSPLNSSAVSTGGFIYGI